MELVDTRSKKQKEDTRKFTIILVNERGEFEAYFLRSGVHEGKNIQWCSRCIWQFDTFDEALDLIKASRPAVTSRSCQSSAAFTAGIGT